MTQSWEAIRMTINTMVDKGVDSEMAASLRSLLKLVESIEASPFAYGLHPWTSMFSLCIAQTEVKYPYDGPYLKITPLKGDRLEFRYLDTLKEADQWHRVTDGCNGFQQLNSFLSHLHWFSHSG